MRMVILKMENQGWRHKVRVVHEKEEIWKQNWDQIYMQIYI